MPTIQSLLTIRLLGTPLVGRAGATWSLSSQKAQALFYYLAVTGQAYTRDHLTALLWGDAPLSDARHSLRSSLHKLRQALRQIDAADALLAEDDRLRLDLALVDCDVARFQRLVAEASAAALHEAVDLVRGPLLQGFSLPDASIFAEFVHMEEARIARGYLGALERLATLAEQRADWTAAISYVERIISLDPLDEPAQQRLMTLYVRGGAPGLARRQYQHFERTMRDELGLAPALEARETLRKAVEQRRSDSSLAMVAAPATPPASLPFVGRADLLARLQRAARRVGDGGGSALILEGAAGIGKSRLIAELVAHLRAESGVAPWTILHGRCSPFDAILAYGAFREALHPLLPEPLTPAASDQQEREGEGYSARVLATLAALARRGPTMLVLDDLHLADRQTVELFGYLACHLQRLPILLIGTVQDLGEVPALKQLAVLGRRRGELEQLTLAPLAREAVDGLLAELGVVAPALASLGPWIYRRSDGNPFVVEALLAQLRADGILVPQGGALDLDLRRWIGWRAATAMPQSTYDLVSLRLTLLRPAARQVLNLLALAADWLTPDELATALAMDGREIGEALEELLGLRLAFEQGPGVALPHQLLRETVLAQLSGLAQRCAHQRLAVALEARGPADYATRVRIARHAVAAGEVERARRVGLALIADVPSALVGAETVSFLQQLYELLAPSAAPDELRCLTRALGHSLRLIGQIEPAGVWHRRQLELARQAGSPAAEADAHFALAELALLSNDYAAAATSARAGLARAAQLGPERGAALQGRGHGLLGGALAMEGGDLPGAERQLQRAIAAHRASGDRVHLGAALFELGNVVAQRGAIGRACELYSEAAAAAEAAQAPFLLALAYNNQAYHSLLLGRLESARRAASLGRAVAEEHGLNSVLLHLLSTEGEIQLYAGNWAAAEAACRHGLSLAEAFDSLERQAGYKAGLARAAAGRGQPEAATALLEGALAQIAGRGYWHLRTRLLIWLVEVALAADPVAADPYLETALGLARGQGRELLLLQVERLAALRLAAGGEHAAATGRLLAMLDQTASLELGLETARTRAALARVLATHAPSSVACQAILDEALAGLAQHGAQAERAELLRVKALMTGPVTLPMTLR